MRLIRGLEKPGEHRLKLAANMLATAIGTNCSDMARDPDPDQDDVHGRSDYQDPERQPERSASCDEQPAHLRKEHRPTVLASLSDKLHHFLDTKTIRGESTGPPEAFEGVSVPVVERHPVVLGIN
jgi:hypothetical protein